MSSKSRYSDLKRGTNTASQPPQWTEYLCCSVCQKDFNRSDRCPISLGCGHTLCRTCLEKLEQPLCHFDQTPIKCNKFDLPVNSALLQLLPGAGDTEKSSSQHMHISQNAICDSKRFNQYVKSYETSRACIDDLALYLKPGKASDLSRPMQRKLVALINCQLLEDEGQKRVLRACRALGERTATELILLHQNPTTLSASLWAAVRARGCQFLGPAMQEEALKLIHLALEDDSELSRKVLVQIVVKNLQPQFSQASKTSIGHVVQLLYRASCFKVTKRDGESSLMRLKEEFLTYEELRKEHDSQIVQIAREAGLRIAPDQWSALLYGDQTHKSHMQSIIDRLQSGGSFQQCIADLRLALQRFNDPGHIHKLLPHFKFLSEVDTENPSWDCLEKSTCFAKLCVKELVEFTNHHHHWLWQCQDATQQTSKYKTSMCRDSKNKGICPRGQSCTFAHTEAELQLYRNRRKKGGQMSLNQNEFKMENSRHCEKTQFSLIEKSTLQDSKRLPSQTIDMSQQHICQCGNTINQGYGNNLKSSSYFQEQGTAQSYPSVQSPSISHNLNVGSNSFQPNLIINQSIPVAGTQQVASILPPPTTIHQSSQIHYVARNQLVFEPKTPTYEPVQIFSDNSSQFTHRVPLAPPEIQSHTNNTVPTALVQPNHYVVHGQQNSGYYQLQPSQVQTVLSDPPMFPHHNYSTPPPNYTCLTLQSGQQVNLPTPNQNVVQQSPATFQQPPIQVHNVSPNPSINYGRNVIVPAGAPITPHLPVANVLSPQPLISARPLRTNEPFVTSPPVMPSVVVPSEDFPIIPNSIYTQCHVVVPSKVDSSASLAELRHRKDEVINKLVKKRIAAPKIEENLNYKVGSYCDIPVESASLEKTPKHDIIPISISCNSFMTPSISTPTLAFVHEPGKNYENTSKGHYSLWSGVTCIPNLKNISLYEEYNKNTHTGIDVVSDLDTSTSQVPAFQDDNSYLGKYTNSEYSNASELLQYGSISQSFHSDDEIISIKDQRIVSKYGPIARTIRSKTTGAIPEQVTANGMSKTHAFPSDKNRKKSNFVAAEQDGWPTYIKSIRSDVEPTAETSKLPDVVCTNYVQTPSQVDSLYMQDIAPQLVIPPDANEDLLLAIELQQIEMGIQRIQRDSCTS